MVHYILFRFNGGNHRICLFIIIRMELAGPGDQILGAIMDYIIVIVTAQCIYYDFLMVMPVLMGDLGIGLFL